MDFRKFRMGGELSDIKVIVDGEEYQLHRFPLYTRSDYFLKEFAKLGAQQVVTLDDFPGGHTIFPIIADFCYNITAKITVDNVVGLRCGAKYLEMYGSGNLYERTGLIIEQIANETRHGRNLEKLLTLISTIAAYDKYDTTQQTLELCVSALVHHWNKYQYGTTSLYEVTTPEVQSLFFSMDFEFFLKLIRACKERLESNEVLCTLVSEYVLHIINSDSAGKPPVVSDDANTTTAGDDEDKADDEAATDDEDGEKPAATEDDKENGDETADAQHESADQTNNDDATASDDTTEETASDATEKEQVEAQQSNDMDETEKDIETAKITFSEESLEKIQSLLESIRPVRMSRKVAAKWLCPLLEAYSDVDGSDKLLGRIAALMANQMDEECVATMSEETLLAFADQVVVEELSENTQSLLLEHLVNLADAERLTVGGFMELIKRMPLNNTACHDSLLNIISQLNSKDGLSGEQLKESLSRIDMKKCTVSSLRRASQNAGIPSDILAKAALDLCDGLQEKLDVSARIIQEQEKEISSISLQPFGTLHVDTSPPSRSLYKGRSTSQSSLYSPAPRIEVTSPSAFDSPTARLGRVMDGMWASERNSSHLLYDTPNSKLAELLRRQRQSRFK